MLSTHTLHLLSFPTSCPTRLPWQFEEKGLRKAGVRDRAAEVSAPVSFLFFYNALKEWDSSEDNWDAGVQQ